jgi:hypothetical protein
MSTGRSQKSICIVGYRIGQRPNQFVGPRSANAALAKYVRRRRSSQL